MACFSTVLFSALCLVTIAIASSSPEDQIVPETDISIVKDFEEAHDTLVLLQDQKLGCKCRGKEMAVSTATAAFLEAMSSSAPNELVQERASSDQTELVQAQALLKGTKCQQWSTTAGKKWCTVSSSCKAATGVVKNVKIKGKCIPFCHSAGFKVPAKMKCATSDHVVATRKAAKKAAEKKKKAAEKKKKAAAAAKKAAEKRTKAAKAAERRRKAAAAKKAKADATERKNKAADRAEKRQKKMKKELYLAKCYGDAQRRCEEYFKYPCQRLGTGVGQINCMGNRCAGKGYVRAETKPSECAEVKIFPIGPQWGNGLKSWNLSCGWPSKYNLRCSKVCDRYGDNVWRNTKLHKCPTTLNPSEIKRIKSKYS